MGLRMIELVMDGYESSAPAKTARTELLVLTALAWHANEGAEAEKEGRVGAGIKPGMDLIARRVRLHQESVRRIVRGFVDGDWLRIIHRVAGRGCQKTEYALNLERIRRSASTRLAAHSERRNPSASAGVQRGRRASRGQGNPSASAGVRSKATPALALAEPKRHALAEPKRLRLAEDQGKRKGTETTTTIQNHVHKDRDRRAAAKRGGGGGGSAAPVEQKAEPAKAVRSNGTASANSTLRLHRPGEPIPLADGAHPPRRNLAAEARATTLTALEQAGIDDPLERERLAALPGMSAARVRSWVASLSPDATAETRAAWLEGQAGKAALAERGAARRMAELRAAQGITAGAG